MDAILRHTTVPPAGLATTDFSVDSEPSSGEVASRADTTAWTQPQIQSRVTVAAPVGHSRLSTGNTTNYLDRARMLRDTLLLTEPGRVDRPAPQDFGIASVAATAPAESAQDDSRWLSALELAFAELRPGDVTAWASLN